MARSKALPLTEDEARRKLHTRLDEWAKVALAPQGLAPARHHKLMMQDLEGLTKGRWDRLMILLPPGSAKSTYTSVNVLMGTLGAMSTSVVSYWVGSSAGSARKDDHLAKLADRA